MTEKEKAGESITEKPMTEKTAARIKARIREVIVVEGRYDKNTLAQIIDAPIVTLEGFAFFHDREKLAYLRRLAETRGLIVFTDSDGAGFVLRRYLKGALPAERVRHAYIPDVPGKERRKRSASKEGKLGVEGMRPEILLDCLRRAGATFLDEEAPQDSGTPQQAQDSSTPQQDNMPPLLRGGKGGVNSPAPITKADLFAWGLSGGAGSAERRRKLLRKLSLPEKMGSNAMLEALNLLFDRESLLSFINENLLNLPPVSPP